MSSGNSSRKRKADAFLEALKTLTSEDAQEYYAIIDPTMLNPGQYERLSTIHNRLRRDNTLTAQDAAPRPDDNQLRPSDALTARPNHDQLRPDDVLTTQDSTPRQKGRGRPSKRSKEGSPTNDSWKGVKDLIEISLDPDLSELMENSKEKPDGELAALFINRCSLQHSLQVTDDSNPKNVLASLLIQLTKRTTSTSINGVCWLYQALAVGDMFVKTFGMDPILRMPQPIKQALQDAVVPNDRSPAFPKDVLEGLLFASNIWYICDLLGTGCLFFLRSQLTKHFLKHLVTKNGEIVDAMRKNFRERGFRQQIEQSGAPRVGEALRAHFRVAIKLDKPEPGSDLTAAAALTSTQG